MKYFHFIFLYFLLFYESSFALVQLSHGYNSIANRGVIQKCITSNIEVEGSFQTNLNIYHSMNRSQLVKDISDSFYFDGFHRLDHNFASKLSRVVGVESDSKLNLYFSVDVSGLKLMQKDIKIDQSKKNLSNEQFLATCGDSFVSQAEYAGKLYIAIQFDFFSKKEKEIFQLNSSIGNSSLENFFTHFENNQAIRRNIHISINAFQYGGNALSLTHLLTNDLVSCDLQSMAKCKSAVSTIIRYISAPDGFINQIKSASFDEILSWEPINAQIKTYHEIDSEVGAISIPQSFTESKIYLIHQALIHSDLIEAIKNRQLQDHSGVYREELASELKNVNESNQKVQNLIGDCRARTDECLNNLEIAIETLDLFPVENIKLPNLHFVDYCFAKENEPEAYKTIQALKKSLTSGEEISCHNLFLLADTKRAISLENMNLTDIRPLANLLHLKFLDLSHNQVEEIKPLQNLKNLRWLDVSVNHIKDIDILFDPLTLNTLISYGNDFDDSITANNSDYELILLRDLDVCEYHLSLLYKQQLIDIDTYELYKSLGFGPGIVDGKLRNDEFYECTVISNEYNIAI